ncbi:chemotaxis protein CheX [Desulfobacula sp.]
MMKILTTAMMTSTSEVMETMCYLPVEFHKEPVTLNQSGMDKFKPHKACYLKFSGDVSGRVTLLVPRDLLSEMTESFMGESLEHLEEKHRSGTLTEILNIICGNALSKIDSNTPFELDIPEVMDASKLPGTQLFTLIETTESMMAMSISMD